MKKVFAFIKKHSMAAVSALTTFVAANESVLDVYANNAEDQLIKSVLNVIFKLFTYIGILLLAWSVGMLVLAFKNEDADSKSRAIMLMVVSVILISIRVIIKPVINASGVIAL